MFGTHIAVPSLAHRNMTESEMCQKHAKIAPRALQESGVQRASGALQRAQEEAQPPPKEYSGALAVPKCARTDTLDGILAQREVRP